MKKNIITYFLIIIGILISIIIYLSLIGIETDKFNDTIKDKVSQNNNQLDIQLKKIKLTLDPFNFKINAKTIGTKLIFQKKVVELESIKTKISFNSLFKNKLVSSNFIVSTRSVLLKDLVGFLRVTTNRAELFFLEKSIEKGYAIIDLELSFDKDGNIKKDYRIKGLLKDGKISLLNDYNLENINFSLNIENDNYNFKEIKFSTNDIDFFSDSLKIKKNKKEFFVEGYIENEKSILNDKLLNLIKLNFNNVNFVNIKFASKNDFSFNLNKKLKFKNLTITSKILIDETEYYKPEILNDYFSEVKDKINLKDHKIEAIYKKDYLSIKGTGKIQLEKDFDEIDYSVSKINDKVDFDSNIKISELKIKNQKNIQKNIKTFFPKIKETINLKDHQVNIKFKDNDLSIKGTGKIQLEKDFDEIDYSVSKINDKVDFDSNIKISELKIKNQKNIQKNIKTFFPKIKETINLKDHQVNIKFKDNDLSIKGTGKIQLEKDFDEIDYSVSKINDKVDFDSNLIINKTSFQIEKLDYKKEKNSKLQLTLSGNYEKTKGLVLDQFVILNKKNKIKLNNLLVDKYKRIIKFDDLNLDFFDTENRRNKLSLKRIKKNNYELNGSIFNANKLINDLLTSKEDKHYRIFKNNLNLNLNLTEVYIDDSNILNNLKGNFYIENNKISQANISALFDNNESLTFTINTNNGEKITTLFSSRAKPLVKKYKFIKGFEESQEGYLDFYSSKKDGISNSKLIIDNFKVKEIPALAKLLALASLQGIADLLTGEGIRFTDFEMNFTNKNNYMTIEELYAIGPAISILIQGYIEQDNLISLKGTLVPATTINRTIASIPLIGDLLIGKKVGDGVFGVSFKIKGPPKDLKTTVNPIKTLTPRFITRTLEKIKKN